MNSETKRDFYSRVAQLVYEYYNGNIAFCGKSKRFYLYNEMTCLWEKEENTDHKIYSSTLYSLLKRPEFNRRETHLLRCRETGRHVLKVLSEICANEDFIRGKLNSKKTLLPIADNKTVDLTTGEVRDRVAEDLFTFESPVNVMDDDLSVAHAYFLELADGDYLLSRFLKVFTLYLLSGLKFENKFYQIIGPGCNGKSQYLRAVEKMLDNGLGIFCGPIYSHIINGFASAANRGIGKYRFAYSGECWREINSDTVGHLTGEKTISGAPGEENFIMTAKYIIMDNNLLTIGADVKDKTMVIPFNHRYSLQSTPPTVDPLNLSRIFTVCLNEGKNFLRKGCLPDYGKMFENMLVNYLPTDICRLVCEKIRFCLKKRQI